jgi:hypothetical protein
MVAMANSFAMPQQQYLAGEAITTTIERAAAATTLQIALFVY